MSSLNSRLDIIVLGATGFTGQYVVKKLALINNEADYSDMTWGIAGRSKEKLDNLVKTLNDQGVNITHIPVIECDITNEATIYEVCRRAKVIVNSTGPCTILSEPIVKACIQTKTHYVDISAELHIWSQWAQKVRSKYRKWREQTQSTGGGPSSVRPLTDTELKVLEIVGKAAVDGFTNQETPLHMLSIYRSYHKAAEEANVLIISACGYGSIPGVMGFVHLENHFNGTLQTVECYTEIEMPKRVYSFKNILCGGNNCLVHYGTWNSLVHELKNFPDYFRIKKETYPEPIYGPEPEEMKKSFFHRVGGKTWFPYPGPDSNIIDMTQRYLHGKNVHQPVNFKMYTTMPLLIHLILIIPIFYCYYWLSYFKCFRSLLRRYPRFFTAGFMSHEGPSEENMHDTKYSFILSGKGSNKDKNETMHLKVSGTHPYEATAITFIFSAITILKDNLHMPKGGVLTTGAAFYKTNLVERLDCHGIHFEFTSDGVRIPT